MHAACGITTHHLINFNSFSLTLFSRHKESTELLCSQLNKYPAFLMEKDFITNCHLLTLSVDEDDVNQQSLLISVPLILILKLMMHNK